MSGAPDYRPHPLKPYPPLIVNAALTGMVASRKSCPHLPETPEQIVREACLCYEAGAAIVHLHARDAKGLPEWRRERYEEIIPAIRRECPDVVVCVTTSGRAVGDVNKRGDVLRLEGESKPDLASLTLGSMNFARSASVNSPDTIRELATRMREAGVLPELEIFDSGMAYLAHHLAAQGELAEPFYANLILGSPNTAPATARDLAHLVDALPPGTIWSGGALGAFQLPVNGLSIFMGGHVRTGLEDNPYLDHATRTPASNQGLVRRVAALAATAGRRVASPAEVRQMLGLRPMPGRPFQVRRALIERDRAAMLEVLAQYGMHEVPSDEMPGFEHGEWFVAEAGGEVVGVCGFGYLHEEGKLIGKTKLLAVDRGHSGCGIGRALQRLRMGMMRDAGAAKVRTCADRPETIEWYEQHFGYRQVGRIPKLHAFGLREVDHWTVLEAPLD